MQTTYLMGFGHGGTAGYQVGYTAGHVVGITEGIVIGCVCTGSAIFIVMVLAAVFMRCFRR